MQRIATATRVPDLFGVGKAGFRDGDLVGGFAPTDFNAAWPNAVQEEILSIIESAGIAPGAAMTQMRQAARRMFGGNVKQITHVGSPHALTADDAGLVLINAVGGSVVVNLPAANVLAGMPFRLRRIDTASGKTVTVNRTGADTIDEGGTSFTIAPKGTQVVESNGVSTWSTSSGLVLATSAEAQSFAGNKLITPATLAAAFQGSNQSLVDLGYQKMPGGAILQWGHISVATSTTATVSVPVAFPNAFRQVVVSMRDPAANYNAQPVAAAVPASLSTFTLRNYYNASGLAYSYIAIGN